jgi:hypothetical protein
MVINHDNIANIKYTNNKEAAFTKMYPTVIYSGLQRLVVPPVSLLVANGTLTPQSSVM